MNLIKIFGTLSILQVINLLVPLLVYPYLIRIYGSSIYGEYVFAMAIASMLQVIINYGFDLGGTKYIAENSSSKEKISKIYSSILLVKVVLSAIIIASICLLHLWNDFNLFLVLLCFFYVAVESIFPIFLYNGLEMQKLMAFIQLPFRILYLGLVYLFIKKGDGIEVVALFQLVVSLLAFFVSFVYLKVEFKLSLCRVDLRYLKYVISDSSIYFLSRLSGIINLKAASLTIGTLFNPSLLAMYDLCMKIVDLLRMPITIINQVIYPRIVKTKDFKLIKFCIILFSAYGLLAVLSVHQYGSILIRILGGDEMYEANNILLKLVILVPMSAISWILGNNVLIAFGYKKYFFISVLCSTAYLTIYFAYLIFLSPTPTFDDVLLGVFTTAGIILIARIFYSVKVYKIKYDEKNKNSL